jgi:fibronectin type 3 domain-containing protein
VAIVSGGMPIIVPPGIPGAFNATRGSGVINCTWTAAAQTTYPIASYNLYINNLVTHGLTGTSTTFSLPNNVAATCWLTAVDALGIESQPSTVISLTVAGAPNQLAAPTVAITSSTSLTVSGVSAGGTPTGFNVYRNGVRIGANPTTTATPFSVLDSGLTQGTAYTYTTTAVNGSGESIASPATVQTPCTVSTAPQAVTATAGNTTATVSWNLPSSLGGGTISTYNIYRNGSLIATPAGSAGRAVVDSGLTNGTAYTYTISATNQAGEGPQSIGVNCVPSPPPPAPATVTLTQINTGFTVSWTDAAFSGAAITSHNVAVSVNGGAYGAPVNTSATSLAVSGYHYNDSLTVRVSALNTAGEGPTATNTGTVATIPDQPVRPTISVIGDTSLSLAWSAPAINGSSLTGYLLYRNGAYLTSLGAVTSYTDNGLTNGVAYRYQVQAYNGMGGSALSAVSSPDAVPFGVPLTPSPPAALAQLQYDAITWSAPSNNGSAITAYNIYRNGTYIATPSGGTLSFNDGAVVYGNSYTYTVQAANARGLSPISGASGSVVPYSVPATPGVPNVYYVGDTQLGVSWPIAGDNGKPVTSYRLCIQGGGVIDLPVSSLGYAAPNYFYPYNGLVNGTTYNFGVFAQNAVGFSAFSGYTTTGWVPYGVPAQVTGVTVTQTGNPGELKLAWTAPANGGSDITHYNLYNLTTGWSHNAWTPSQPFMVDTNLPNNYTETFQVSASNARGEGSRSIAVSGTTPGPPPDVTGFVWHLLPDNQTGGHYSTGSWNASPTATLYYLRMYTFGPNNPYWSVNNYYHSFSMTSLTFDSRSLYYDGGSDGYITIAASNNIGVSNYVGAYPS